MKIMGWLGVVAAGLGIGLFSGKLLRPLPADAYGASFAPAAPAVIGASAAPPRGPAHAPIVVAVFSDFECPHSALAARHLADLVDGADDVQLWFKQMPSASNPHSLIAAFASLAAANQGRFWPYHDALFADRTHLERADLVARAKRLGLDVARFERDLDAPETRRTLEAELREVGNLALEGTPTVFINGRRIKGPIHVAGLRKLVEEARLALPSTGTAMSIAP